MRGRARFAQRLGLESWLVPITFTMATLTWVPPSSLASGQDSPTLDYTLTRVFGADSDIRGACLSPDGRWIVFAEADWKKTRSNLWLISTAGGETIPLTNGPYVDDAPIWFPSGDRIAFGSTRPPIWAIMTLPLDTATGQLAGPPRQVTLDQVSNYCDVSPDGKWIAYSASGVLGSAIRVIPATGGIARTLSDAGGFVHMWSPDGRNIYYVTSGTRSSGRVLMKVPVAGGRPETVFTWPSALWLPLGGPNRHFVLREAVDISGVEIATLEGQSVGRLSLPPRMGLIGISRQGDEILATRGEWGAPAVILPIKGGPGRQLKETSGYDEPFGWSEDGRVLFKTELEDEEVLLYAPASGGPMPQVKLPEPRMQAFDPVLSGDGGHVLYAVKESGSELTTLKVYSVEENWSWELSRHCLPDPALGQTRLSGAGGTYYRDGDDFLYFETREGHYFLVASPPQGPPRVMRTFADRLPGSVAVNGNRIAYIQNSKSEGTLFVATAGHETARQILTLQGMLDMVVWSPDGRRMAAYHFDPTRSSRKDWDPAGRDLIVLEVNPSGGLAGEPDRHSVPGGHWWSPRWLPDGQGILVNGMDGNVWLISLDPNARPVAITQDDPNSVWHFRLSPDGRHIVYPSERSRGSSIWLLKLGEPLARD